MVNIFTKWKQGLSRTRNATFGQIASFFGATEISQAAWENLEEVFYQSDFGIETTTKIISDLKKYVNENGITRAQDLQSHLYTTLMSCLLEPPAIDFENYHPMIILLVGVNGSGKTTTAAKLADNFKRQGKKVILGAADTFRAAAIDQLQVWGERMGLPVIGNQPNADPGAVAYDTVQAAISRKLDIAIIDTAGRLHTKYNLMEELKKVYRVVGKALPGSPHATWLVLDATTGQNALHQARAFKEAIQITGIILVKLDTSAKGGMAFAIQREMGLPILYAGLGESLEDLVIFNRDAFVTSILTNTQED